jgi:hypothetical protein
MSSWHVTGTQLGCAADALHHDYAVVQSTKYVSRIVIGASVLLSYYLYLKQTAQHNTRLPGYIGTVSCSSSKGSCPFRRTSRLSVSHTPPGRPLSSSEAQLPACPVDGFLWPSVAPVTAPVWCSRGRVCQQTRWAYRGLLPSMSPSWPPGAVRANRDRPEPARKLGQRSGIEAADTEHNGQRRASRVVLLCNLPFSVCNFGQYSHIRDISLPCRSP